MPPMPPELPVFTPCPEGWRELPYEGTVVCDPWPEGGPSTCPKGQMQLPGEPACRAVDGPCPVGQYAEDLQEPILYVSADAAPAGDGTLARPLASVNEALRRATIGTTIALAKGRYEEAFQVETASVAIVGACVAETVLHPIGHQRRAIVRVMVPGVKVRGMTISGTGFGVSVPAPGASADVRGVAFEDVDLGALAAASGGRLTLREVLIRDVRSSTRAPDGVGGTIYPGGVINIDGVAFERIKGRAFEVIDGHLHVSRTVVRDSELVDLIGGTASFDRAVLEDIYPAGIVVYERTRLSLNDVLIRRIKTRLSHHPDLGPTPISSGLGCFDDCVLTARRLRIEDYGVFGWNFGGRARFDLEDVWTADGRADGQIDATVGLSVVDASGELTRAGFVRTRGAAISASTMLTRVARLTGRDVTIHDTFSDDIGWLGVGIGLEAGAEASIERAHISRSRADGVIVGGGAALTLVDTVITDTQPQSFSEDTSSNDGRWGLGMQIAFASTVHLTRVEVSNNRESGIAAFSPGTVLTAEDLVIKKTRPNIYGILGRGLNLEDGVRFEGSRIRIEDNYEAAVIMLSSYASISDLVIDRTRQRLCVVDSCPNSGGGFAIVLAGTATATLSRFALRENELGGIQLADNAQLDLYDGEVSGNAIGVNLQISGYDLQRLANRVLYRNNGLNLDAADVAIPDASPFLPH
jgi:hypothetical protein